MVVLKKAKVHHIHCLHLRKVEKNKGSCRLLYKQ